MSLPSLFIIQKLPSTIIVGQGFCSHLVSRLSSAAQSVNCAKQSMSFSIDCGPLKQVRPLCHRSLSHIGSGTINTCQTRSPAAADKVHTGLCSNKMLYFTHLNLAKAAQIGNWRNWLWLLIFDESRPTSTSALGTCFASLITYFSAGC